MGAFRTRITTAATHVRAPRSAGHFSCLTIKACIIRVMVRIMGGDPHSRPKEGQITRAMLAGHLISKFPCTYETDTKGQKRCIGRVTGVRIGDAGRDDDDDDD